MVKGSCVPSAGALVGSRQDECCWSLNGRNRSAAHEWPAGGGGRHLLVLLCPAQCTGSHPIKHSNSSSASSSALLPKQPLLAVRRRAERAGGGDERPLRVRAGAALGGGGLVAGLGGLGDAAQQRVAEQAGQAGGENRQAAPAQPPGNKKLKACRSKEFQSVISCRN